MSMVAIDDVYSPSGEGDELLELRGLTPARIEEAVRGVVGAEKVKVATSFYKASAHFFSY